jgi:hypothetical protein
MCLSLNGDTKNMIKINNTIIYQNFPVQIIFSYHILTKINEIKSDRVIRYGDWPLHLLELAMVPFHPYATESRTGGRVQTKHTGPHIQSSVVVVTMLAHTPRSHPAPTDDHHVNNLLMCLRTIDRSFSILLP